MDWRHRAVCRDEDPELFFPVGTSGPALLQIAQAKTVCRRCPVAASCLTWALQSGQDAGVWGGMSEDERRALKRRNARTRARTAKRNRPTRLPTAGPQPDSTRRRARGRSTGPASSSGGDLRPTACGDRTAVTPAEVNAPAMTAR